MMRAFSDIPIKQKLMITILVTTASALLLAGVAIVLTDSLLFRGYLRRDLSALARIIADNTTAAVAFDDPKSAGETLGALRARAHVIDACVYKADGSVLANYARGGGGSCPPAQPPKRHSLYSGRRGGGPAHYSEWAADRHPDAVL